MSQLGRLPVGSLRALAVARVGVSDRRAQGRDRRLNEECPFPIRPICHLDEKGPFPGFDDRDVVDDRVRQTALRRRTGIQTSPALIPF